MHILLANVSSAPLIERQNTMAVEFVTIPRVYLTDPNINRSSGHHTIYASEGVIRPGEDTPPMYRLEFEFGVARNVPQHIYDRFHALGHVTTERPRHPRELADER
jgi:hypothetical protein